MLLTVAVLQYSWYSFIGISNEHALASFYKKQEDQQLEKRRK